MSWGERSCRHMGKCSKATASICNVDCPNYKWDGETDPDSKPVNERKKAQAEPTAMLYPEVVENIGRYNPWTQFSLKK